MGHEIQVQKSELVMEFTKENINSILRDKYFENAERDHERRNRKDYRRRVRAYKAAQVKQEPT